MKAGDELPTGGSDEFQTWFHGEGFLARRVARPTSRFIHLEAAGGLVLLAATAFTLVLANSPWSDPYQRFWSTELSISLGNQVISHDLTHWVNDALMVLFFFVVGLEIKKELVVGQLSDLRDASLPVVAAIGGMIVPAALYFAINSGGAGAGGWGIPMATDIAFAVGVLALLGDRVPGPLKVMLLALAIVDDIGAIAVIAFFYSDGINLNWLATAAAGVVLTVAMRRASVWYVPLYVAIGVFVWFATLRSGVHATIAGVTLGLLTPAVPLLDPSGAVPTTAFELRESVSVAERLQQLLHPWTSFVVIPLFALANAGIVISRDMLSDAAGSRITIGIVLGLLLGKLVGITGAVALTVKLRLAKLPAGVTLAQVAGMAMVAGIGFTVSLFISGLAFDDSTLDAQAKMGILIASAVAATLGLAGLRLVLGRPSPADSGSETERSPDC